MANLTLSDADTTQALKLWDVYQHAHDVSARRGQAVGIDPHSGQVWFGESIVDITEQMDKAGIDVPLYFTRVGFSHYARKGGRR